MMEPRKRQKTHKEHLKLPSNERGSTKEKTGKEIAYFFHQNFTPEPAKETASAAPHMTV